MAAICLPQLLDLSDDVLELVMLNKNPGLLTLVSHKFREIVNGDNLLCALGTELRWLDIDFLFKPIEF